MDVEISQEKAINFLEETLKVPVPHDKKLLNVTWLEKVIRAFHANIPFQNISFLCREKTSVPTWPEIERDVIDQGKGGLCLSLNLALVSVLRGVGISAHNASADYVATRSRGVHVIALCMLPEMSATRSVLDLTDALNNKEAKATFGSTEGEKLPYFEKRSSSLKKKCSKKKSLSETFSNWYFLDVGCGYPTLEPVHLDRDLGRIFSHCGFEYQFVRKGRRYFRLHRGGEDIPDEELKLVQPDGWRNMFSFTTTAREMDHFKKTMTDVYINPDTSSYFHELHAVLYLNSEQMLVVKNKCARGAADWTTVTVLNEPLRFEMKTRITRANASKALSLDTCQSLTPEKIQFYPVGEGVQRLLQNDVVLSGYKVPAGTHIEMNPYIWLQSDRFFTEPNLLKPERWLREESGESVHPYVLTPFSIGPRMCAGRRFAEQDLYTGVCRLLLKFRLCITDPKPPEQKWRILLHPLMPLPIRFIPRI